MNGKILIVEARFYDEIANHQLEGAKETLDKAGIHYDVVSVPGALEIPPAIRYAMNSKHYIGYVALGCVIRGETSHYDTVCNESARGIMDLGVHHGAAIGNGILTVENKEQAMDRADKSRKNKGGGAAEACLALIKLKSTMENL